MVIAQQPINHIGRRAVTADQPVRTATGKILHRVLRETYAQQTNP